MQNKFEKQSEIDLLKFDLPELIVLSVCGIALVSYGLSLISLKPVLLLIGLFVTYKTFKTILNN